MGRRTSLALVDRPRVVDDEGDDRLAMELHGHDRQRRRQPEAGHDPELVGGVGDEVPQQAEDLGRVVHRPRHHTGEHGGAERMEPELEGRDDAEVAAAAPEAPEQVGVLLLAGDEKFAVGRDDVAGHEESMASPNLRMR